MTNPSTTHDWQRLGSWPGGMVTAIAVSPDFATDRLALAATAAGLFRSSDGGVTWQPGNSGLTDRSLVAVAFAPQNQPNTLRAYAASEGGRLYTSTDGGATWRECEAWAGLGVATVLVPSPNFTADLTLFVGAEEGVFRSQDGGQSWESALFGLHDLDVLCIACAPDYATSEVVWAGTANGGFYRSRNSARSWRDAGVGLPDDAVTCVLISPMYAVDQTLYVGTEGSGLYRSTDGGATWAPWFSELAVEGMLCLAAADRRFVLGTGAGLYYSDDGGESWLPAGGEEAVATSLALGSSGVVLAAAEAGVYRSTDEGESWQRADEGIVAHAPPIVQRSPRGELVALDRFGTVGISTDGGVHWRALELEGEVGPVTALAVATQEDQTVLYLATLDGGLAAAPIAGTMAEWRWLQATTPADRLFHHIAVLPGASDKRLLVAADDGQLYRWDGADALEQVAEPLPWHGEALLQLAVSPDFAADPRVVAVSARQNSVGNYGVQLWESLDSGLHWENLAALETAVPAVALCWPVDPAERSLFLATQNRVIRLFRAGSDTELVAEQHFLDHEVDHEVNITALAATPRYRAERDLWAATSCGLYHSTDDGASWVEVGAALANRPVVACFPDAGAQMLLAVELGGTVWTRPLV
jgi:photosystem II stability/assembly factor-like uncharacterized protein